MLIIRLNMGESPHATLDQQITGDQMAIHALGREHLLNPMEHTDPVRFSAKELQKSMEEFVRHACCFLLSPNL